MTQITDLKAAVIAVLLGDATVSGLVGTNVFGDELPRDETDDIEQKINKAIVVSPSGGTPPSYTVGTVPLEAQRLDIFSYGENLFEAEKVRGAAYGALKSIDRVNISGVLLHWANPAGGVASGRDPDTDWPFKWDSWQVLGDNRATP